jgi:cell division protease FtsH
LSSESENQAEGNDASKRQRQQSPGKKPSDSPTLGELGRRLRTLRRELLRSVIGQDHAVHGFVAGLFNIEILRDADSERCKPAGLFVFAGPPGVGKTFLAETGAGSLGRPFLRFDMSGFGQDYEVSGLVGSPPIYKGAQAGALTGFVKEHPDAVVLFDEIERAHPTVIQLFLQILDAGRLQDKFTEETVPFRDTIIIFTTNAGEKLYNNPNASGIHLANVAFHRNTILDALRTEEDPRRGRPIFPAAICSRMATGYPILFNHLGIDELSQIAAKELLRVCGLLTLRHGQHYLVSPEIALALVMREGAGADARRIKSQAEVFLKEEVFKISALFDDDGDLAKITTVEVLLDDDGADELADSLFRQRSTPKVLFVGSPWMAQQFNILLADMQWHQAADIDRALDVLAKEEIDFALLDLNLGRGAEDTLKRAGGFADVTGLADTVVAFRRMPPAARRHMVGQRILEQLRTRMPELPVLIFSPKDAQLVEDNEEDVDDEALIAVVRSGGARGVVRCGWPLSRASADAADLTAFREQIEGIVSRLRRERMAGELSRRNEVIFFDTAPVLQEGGQRLNLRCRNFRSIRAPRSEDTRGLLADVERPSTRFDDVVGAASAKEALLLIRDWLRAPKKYAAMGVEPPRGILLSGPPGTGKTMLARALAGESDCAFLVEAATNFVTMWQGSGPENIRGLFQRARRYAPSIVFIDEIDAVGRKRSGGASGHGEEMALNALLTEMDGFAKSSGEAVIVLAATNLSELLDPALKRRFSREIEVELPTRLDRSGYLQRKLAAKTGNEVSQDMIDRIAAQSQGLSIAHLERILAQASVLALANRGIVTDEVLAEAFERVTHGEAKPGKDASRTARHEAGHALLMCLMGSPPIYVTIVGRGSFGGYAAFDTDERYGAQTKLEIENLICQALGGREAEQLSYRDSTGESTGSAADLEYATRLADAMVCRYGMSEELGLVHIEPSRPLPSAIDELRYRAVRRIIDSQSEKAGRLLEQHQASFERITEALLDRGRLLKAELLALLTEDERSLL